MADPITAGLGAASLGSSVLGMFTSAQGTAIAQQGAQVEAAGAATQFQAAQIQEKGAAIAGQGAALEAAATAQSYTYKAGVATLNKQIMDRNAEYATAVGEVKAQQSGMATRFQIAQTRATQAASGLDINRGSAAAVRESEAEIGDFEQATIRSDSAREAYGYKVEGLNYEAESDLEKVSATNAISAGQIKVAGYKTQEAGFKVGEEQAKLAGIQAGLHGEAAGLQGTASLLGSAGTLSKTALTFIKGGVFS